MTTDLTPQIRRLACYDCGDCGRRIYGIRRIARHSCATPVDQRPWRLWFRR